MSKQRRRSALDFPRLASLRVEILARQARRHADLDYRRTIGLSVLQCRLIGIVGSQGPLNLRELCLGIDVDKPYASRLVADLTKLGFLQKLPDQTDQRSFAVALTGKGRQTYNRIYRIAWQRNERWLDALLPQQRETFFECLDILELALRKRIATSQNRSGLPAGASPRHQRATVDGGRPNTSSLALQQGKTTHDRNVRTRGRP